MTMQTVTDPATVKIPQPTEGEKIEVVKNKSHSVKKGAYKVPNNPIIPYIEGDGIGPDIWAATQSVLDAAVDKAYKSKKRIAWYEIFAGEKSFENFGVWLPDGTLKAIKKYKVAIKGPLTTPVGGGMRSLNVSIRQQLKLNACVRPVSYIPGVPSPVKEPWKLDIVIFRENLEDLYAGIEWKMGSPEAKKLLAYLKKEMGITLRADSGLGLKPISRTGTHNLVRMAIQYAIDTKRDSVTLVHKGNIMKLTEGAFRDWGYEVAAKEFGKYTITEDEVWKKHKGKPPKGKVMIKDRIADAMFQQILTRPDEYSVVATPNLTGDYISDASAAQVGGLGLAPGLNIGKDAALFEATHGTAPKYAGLDKINPGSLILSGAMMLGHMGWNKAADLVATGVEGAVKAKTVTYDLARLTKGSKEIKCSQFGDAIIKHMK